MAIVNGKGAASGRPLPPIIIDWAELAEWRPYECHRPGCCVPAENDPPPRWPSRACEPKTYRTRGVCDLCAAWADMLGFRGDDLVCAACAFEDDAWPDPPKELVDEDGREWSA